MGEVTKDTLVLVVDDMLLRRELIVRFLERWAAEMGLTAVSSSLDDMLALKRLSGYRLVILSHGADSLSEPKLMAARQLLLASVDPGRAVVFLGDRPDCENIERALEWGVAGYVPTSLDPGVAIAALSFVLAGGSYFPPETLLRIGQQPKDRSFEAPQLAFVSGEDSDQGQRPETSKSNGNAASHQQETDGDPEACAAPSGELTLRQQQVLACLKKARSNKEIARELAMSEATVKVHVRQVMKKLGALNRTHAAVLAVRVNDAGEPVLTNVSSFTAYRPSLQHAVGN